ncbi:hypothetical protein GCM10011365_20090 [Marinicella pacifica]|uniref:Uncharacterized protein n=1 Tax=Marinicella pacifica TaxID=1171543 RepID=A0A917CU07_9GAMM|nr:hypothetical protein [Marinicella pacifica]GGF98802.1 hypothetical protein GCM10011365_20090 [Marinicella pacifica]
MINKILDAFLCSFFATLIIGMMVNRLLPTWEGLASDVGNNGVWLVSFIVHYVFGLAVSAGAILSQILSKNVTVSRKFWVITSGVIVTLLHLFLLFVQYEFESYVFFSLLFGMSFVLFLVAIVMWNTLRLNNNF